MQRGSGGACENVNGVEVWTHGAPNRPYLVIGVIEDTRPGGVILMARRVGTVTGEAKRRGGDGIIVIAEGKEYLGSYNTLNQWSTLNTRTHLNANTNHYGNWSHTTGTAYTSGTMSTTGMGMSVPVTKAHGTYLVFKYITGAAAMRTTEQTRNGANMD